MLLAHMGPYLFASAFLTGFFAFGAVYHFILWLTSRRERVLLVFVLVALVVSIQSYAVLSVAVATTVEEGQKALDLRSSGAILTVISLAWLFSAVSNVRAGWYLWSLTTVFLIGLAYSLIVSPMTGVVTAVEPVVTPWGETVTVLHRTSTTAWLQPLYALALSVPVFGGVVARHTWTYDRVGAVLVAV